MKFDRKDPPREYSVGVVKDITIKDCGQVSLEADEQITFKTRSGAEYDVTRKDWGFYATPSMNGRLADFGLRSVLVRNRASSRYFLLLVEEGHEPSFQDYIARENLELLHWLDTDEAFQSLQPSLES